MKICNLVVFIMVVSSTLAQPSSVFNAIVADADATVRNFGDNVLSDYRVLRAYTPLNLSDFQKVVTDVIGEGPWESVADGAFRVRSFQIDGKPVTISYNVDNRDYSNGMPPGYWNFSISFIREQWSGNP